jgi:hypothetical protein
MFLICEVVGAEEDGRLRRFMGGSQGDHARLDRELNVLAKRLRKRAERALDSHDAARKGHFGLGWDDDGFFGKS